MTKEIIPSEHVECRAFKDWLNLKGLLYTKTTQETYTRSRKQKHKNASEGLKPGLPDYIIIAPQGLLFVEMKRIKNSYATKAQKEWIEALNQCDGVQGKVCKGAGEAIEFVERFL
jgi:hypothetical protein